MRGSYLCGWEQLLLINRDLLMCTCSLGEEPDSIVKIDNKNNIVVHKDFVHTHTHTHTHTLHVLKAYFGRLAIYHCVWVGELGDENLNW